MFLLHGSITIAFDTNYFKWHLVRSKRWLLILKVFVQKGFDCNDFWETNDGANAHYGLKNTHWV